MVDPVLPAMATLTRTNVSSSGLIFIIQRRKNKRNPDFFSLNIKPRFEDTNHGEERETDAGNGRQDKIGCPSSSHLHDENVIRSVDDHPRDQRAY